ncbi:MAG: hypothetical protein ABIG34_00195 [Candidatus Peregrinibacteria bacterium]
MKEFFFSRLATRLIQADNDDPDIAEQLTWQLPSETVSEIILTTEGVSQSVRRKVCDIITEDLQEYVCQGWIQILVVRAYIAILMGGDSDRGLQFEDPLEECGLLQDAVLKGWRAHYSPKEE